LLLPDGHKELRKIKKSLEENLKGYKVKGHTLAAPLIPKQKRAIKILDIQKDSSACEKDKQTSQSKLKSA